MKYLAGNFPATGAGGSVLEFEPPAPNARVIEPRNPLSSIGRASPCELFSIPALLLGWQSGSDAWLH